MLVDADTVGVSVGEDASEAELAAVATKELDSLDAYFTKYLPALVTAAVVPPLVGAWILFSDPISALAIVITVPLLFPVVASYGFDPVWFGVMMTMNLAIGQFTPPLAVNLMVTGAVAKVSIESTVRWVMWFVAAMTAALLLVIAIPDLVLWLPRRLGY